MRVRSAQPVYRSLQQSHELKPLNAQDLHHIADLDFNIKICDMGNACYVDNHYSSVI